MSPGYDAHLRLNSSKSARSTPTTPSPYATLGLFSDLIGQRSHFSNLDEVTSLTRSNFVAFNPCSPLVDNTETISLWQTP
ncbi:hypothetical protein PGT21_020116 [Puccinia graminis f. sp. tritici]|uniref:Uncharacterized protein n=1 Tax=Puccinia graminis f. sp. tritici TaxID=56615 RepID=A0A5B0P7H6_PUCGR|nr:hypothetical protein PGT21_020116 [Puccinia graminis f. sp. tritici]